MSTTTSSSAPPPSSSNSTFSNGNAIAISSSVYLFTFVATLVLLLGVSFVIILRSFILRRRHHRMVADAIANGTWPPSSSRGRSYAISDKPKIYDVALGTVVLDDEGSQVRQSGKCKENIREDVVEDLAWDDFLPVSASYLKPSIPSTPNIPSTTSLPSTRNQNPIRTFFIRSQHIPPDSTTPNTASSPSPSPSPSPSASPTSDATSPVQKRVRVAVLIAMPSENPSPFIHAHTHTHIHEPPTINELPCMEFGVTDLTISGKSDHERES